MNQPKYKLLDWVSAQSDKLDWRWLSENPAAIEMLKANPNKINWYYLSQNPAAIDLLKANLDKINWVWLSENPAIFELDYSAIYSSFTPIERRNTSRIATSK